MNPIATVIRAIRAIKRLPDEVRELRKMLAIVRNDTNREAVMAKIRLDEIEKVLREHTTVHMDVAPYKNRPNTVIVVGHWRNRDSVLVYEVHPADLQEMVDRLEAMRRHHRVGRLDAPQAFSACVQHRQQSQL